MPATYGPSGQPSSATFNYDALVSTSLANYRATLTDNVSSTNIIFHKLKAKGAWEACDGGLYIVEDLMYGLAPVDAYDGYDELPLTPTEGITQAQFQWRQLASPISISEKERKQNKHRIVNLVAAKLKQADIGMQEAWGKQYLQGSLAGSGSSLITPYTSPVTGAQSIDPIGLLVAYNTSASLEIGNINQSTAGNEWWKNITKQSAATTFRGYLQELLNLKNSCSKSAGGGPDVALTDQVSWELLSVAYYEVFRTQVQEVGNYPFPVLKFQGVEVSWDQYMPDVHNGVANADTKGSWYYYNTKFGKVRYESETDFVATEFQKPVNMDAKFKHILWMGNTTINNRRKFGVMGNIARTLVP